eukprot:1689666-Pleurochrysis_carterae.AAC.1
MARSLCPLLTHTFQKRHCKSEGTEKSSVLTAPRSNERDCVCARERGKERTGAGSEGATQQAREAGEERRGRQGREGGEGGREGAREVGRGAREGRDRETRRVGQREREVEEMKV